MQHVGLIVKHMTWYQLSDIPGDDDEPEWMIEHAKRESRRAITEKRQEFEARLAKIRQEEERLKQAQDSADRPRKKLVCIYSPDRGENIIPTRRIAT